MKTRFLFVSTLALGLGAIGSAESSEKVEPPVPVSQAAAQPAPQPASDEQKLYGQAATIVSPEKANQVVDAFRAVYEKLGKPRLLFYVNRDLVDEHSGMKLTGRHEKTETTVKEQKSSYERDSNATEPTAAAPQTQVNVTVEGDAAKPHGAQTRPGKGSSESRSTTVTGENTYAAGDAAAPTLADKLTVREIETLAGRPFRIAGAMLADQKTASSLIADKPIDHFTTDTNESARRDREALAKVADVVIEVLVSSRTATVPAVSGDRTVTLPDIQMTAIRLSDSAILGQASAADVLGKDRFAARIANQFDARDVTEATALALMEDLTQTAK
ncbi:hypothetical protein DB347_13390 [Opitutaceae bacterium EW11]|nr:hypothetical protein DB347_25490 [Opitutaceae bacterium EW11]PTY06414.1 hypothetical protein DB347_13390 [Opitutaceae bacterium EW11]